MTAKYDPHHVDIHVGKRVRLRRNQLSVSQSDLALALHLTFQQVQKYERGSNRVSASKLFEIAQKLDVRISYFFEGLEGQSSEPGAGPADVASMAAAVAVPEMTLVTQLGREQQVALGRVIQAMVPQVPADQPLPKRKK